MKKYPILWGLAGCIALAFIILRVDLHPTHPAIAKKDDYSLGKARYTPVSVSNGQFAWPAGLHSYNTVFLQGDLHSNILGELFQSVVNVKCGGYQFTQSFEKGVPGNQYINLSPCAARLKPGDKVSFSSPFLFLPGTKVCKLILFHNDPIDGRSILVIAPHPDDAEMAAFGLYAFRDSTIVTITLGDEGKQKYQHLFNDRAKSYLVKGKLRFWDSITVPFYGGVLPHKSVNLGYFDGTLKTMYANPQQRVRSIETGIADLQVFRKHNISDLAPPDVREATWVNLVHDLVVILQRTHPSIIVMPHPILDTHPDHRYSTLATLEALQQAGTGKEVVYFYSNHFVDKEDWPMGSVESIVNMPPWHDNQFLFDRIDSHAMSDWSYKMKFFALDGMHSLRPSFLWNFDGFFGWAGLAEKALEYGHLRARTFRKSWHPNELFFVVDSAHLHKFDLKALDFRKDLI